MGQCIGKSGSDVGQKDLGGDAAGKGSFREQKKVGQATKMNDVFASGATDANKGAPARRSGAPLPAEALKYSWEDPSSVAAPLKPDVVPAAATGVEHDSGFEERADDEQQLPTSTEDYIEFIAKPAGTIIVSPSVPQQAQQQRPKQLVLQNNEGGVFIFHDGVYRSATIRQCTACLIVLAPTSGLVRIEACKDCILVAACGQLEMRSCRNVTLSLLSPSMPLLMEACEKIGFTCLTGMTAFEGLPRQLQLAHLSPCINGFSTVLDVAKTKAGAPQPYNNGENNNNNDNNNNNTSESNGTARSFFYLDPWDLDIAMYKAIHGIATKKAHQRGGCLPPPPPPAAEDEAEEKRDAVATAGVEEEEKEKQVDEKTTTTTATTSSGNSGGVPEGGKENAEEDAADANEAVMDKVVAAAAHEETAPEEEEEEGDNRKDATAERESCAAHNDSPDKCGEDIEQEQKQKVLTPLQQLLASMPSPLDYLKRPAHRIAAAESLLALYGSAVAVPTTFGACPVPSAFFQKHWRLKFFVATRAQGGWQITQRILRDIELARREQQLLHFAAGTAASDGGGESKNGRGGEEEEEEEEDYHQLPLPSRCGPVLLLNTAEIPCTSDTLQRYISPAFYKITEPLGVEEMMVKKKGGAAAGDVGGGGKDEKKVSSSIKKHFHLGGGSGGSSKSKSKSDGAATGRNATPTSPVASARNVAMRRLFGTALNKMVGQTCIMMLALIDPNAGLASYASPSPPQNLSRGAQMFQPQPQKATPGDVKDGNTNATPPLPEAAAATAAADGKDAKSTSNAEPNKQEMDMWPECVLLNVTLPASYMNLLQDAIFFKAQVKTSAPPAQQNPSDAPKKPATAAATASNTVGPPPAAVAELPRAVAAAAATAEDTAPTASTANEQGKEKAYEGGVSEPPVAAAEEAVVVNTGDTAAAAADGAAAASGGTRSARQHPPPIKLPEAPKVPLEVVEEEDKLPATTVAIPSKVTN